MKERRIDGRPGRRVLIAAVVNKEFLAKITSVWDKEGLFASDWENKVASWCVDYYRRYKKAPGRNIESLFEQWAEKNSDKDAVTAIERFLSSLSEEHARAREIDPDHVTDVAEKLFNKNLINRESQKVEELIEAGQVDKAMEVRDSYRRVTLKGEEHIDPFSCNGEMDVAFAEIKAKPLVNYPGGLGRFFGKQLVRDSLVGIMAAEKMGKSYWLLDIAFRGWQQGRKVAYFQVGDLSRSQILQRVGIRAARRPDHARPYHLPTAIEMLDERGHAATVEREEHRCKKEITAEEVKKALRLEQKKTKGEFRLFVYPNTSVSILGVEAKLDSMAQRGFLPDIISIDYADILAPVDGTAETRDQINQTWSLMRSMSQRRNCLVVTATQASAASYKASQLDKSHFSNDKRKYAHITAMLGINQIDEEKELDLCRLNWLDVRSEAFSRKKFCFAAGCRDIANVSMKSHF